MSPVAAWKKLPFFSLLNSSVLCFRTKQDIWVWSYQPNRPCACEISPHESSKRYKNVNKNKYLLSRPIIGPHHIFRDSLHLETTLKKVKTPNTLCWICLKIIRAVEKDTYTLRPLSARSHTWAFSIHVCLNCENVKAKVMIHRATAFFILFLIRIWSTGAYSGYSPWTWFKPLVAL